MRILVADDNEACRQVLRDLFAGEPNTTVTFAQNGAEAWWYLTEPDARFDVGIFDFKMPVADGLALIHRIRSSTPLRSLPVILCTSAADRDTVTKAARLAINHFVVKPFRPDALREKVRQFAPHYSQNPERTLLTS